MRLEHLEGLVSPATGKPKCLQAVEIEASGEIKQGTLVDASGKHVVPILNFILRFATSGHYADSFGDQWNRYRSIQIDREMKNRVSEEYLYHWTG